MSAPVLPSQLTYGTVRWTVIGLDVDAADANDLPDVISINGTATVTVDVSGSAISGSGLPAPLTILLRGVELLIVNGRLQDKDGHTDVKLLANDSPGLAHLGWSYTITWQLDDGYTFGSFPFYLSSGEALDLTLVAPLVQPEPGVVITKGEAASITIGSVTTAPAGTPASVTNVGTQYDAVLDIVVPQGPAGAGSPPATADALGAVQLAGDLTGPAQAPLVVGLQSLRDVVNGATDVNTPATIVRRSQDGSVALSRVSGLNAPSDVSDAARKSYVDAGDALAVPLTQKGVAGGVSTLDGSGKIPQAQLPAVALTEFLGAVASEAAMLALSGQRGDWCTRTDLGHDYQLIAEPSTSLANWRAMTYPASPVSSVAGRTGAVTIASTDITDATTVGRAVVTAATGAAARTAIGAGTLVASDIASMGRDRGAGTVWPTTDLRRGDVYYMTTVAQLGIYTGSAWRLVAPGVVGSLSARNSLSWAYSGLLITVTSDGVTYEYQNSATGWTRPWGVPWGEIAGSTSPTSNSSPGTVGKNNVALPGFLTDAAAPVYANRKLLLTVSPFIYCSDTAGRYVVVCKVEACNTGQTAAYFTSKGKPYLHGNVGWNDSIHSYTSARWTPPQNLQDCRFRVLGYTSYNGGGVIGYDAGQEQLFTVEDLGPAGPPLT